MDCAMQSFSAPIIPIHHFFLEEKFLWKTDAQAVKKTPSITLRKDFLYAQTAVIAKKGETLLMNPRKVSKNLKISSLYYDSLTDTMAVPYIRLRGRWLKKFGFSIGQLIVVSAGKRRITITPVLEVKNNESERENGQISTLQKTTCKGLRGNGSKIRTRIAVKSLQKNLF